MTGAGRAEARVGPAEAVQADEREAVVEEAELGRAADGGQVAQVAVAAVERADPQLVAALGQDPILESRERDALRYARPPLAEGDGRRPAPAPPQQPEPDEHAPVAALDPPSP